jgi:hypothetical protein
MFFISAGLSSISRANTLLIITKSGFEVVKLTFDASKIFCFKSKIKLFRRFSYKVVTSNCVTLVTKLQGYYRGSCNNNSMQILPIAIHTNHRGRCLMHLLLSFCFLEPVGHQTHQTNLSMIFLHWEAGFQENTKCCVLNYFRVAFSINPDN